MLMTADEVKRRLAEGEDAILLSLEHWLGIAQWLKQHKELPRHAYGAHICPLCLKHRDCDDCPLSQFEGKHCAGPGGCYSVFLHDLTYDNAMGVVAALAKCKSPEPKLPQFYIWQYGNEPTGKVGLRLAQLSSGTIKLIAVDEDGRIVRAGNLLMIFQDGSMRLPVSVNTALGLDLDGRDCLRLQRE